ncbi:MAG: RNA-binding protein [candidate division GAL15 bacterium]
MRDLVEYVLRGIVAHPDRVEVEETDGERGTVLRVRVAPEDVGKVIGRGGRMARALRTLVRAAGMRGGRVVQLEIEDGRPRPDAAP